MRNILTVDVEDWYSSSLALFHLPESSYGVKPDASVVRNTERILELLARGGHKATFFVLGTVAESYPELVQEISRQGHEVASHSYRHRLAYEMSPGEFRDDLLKSINVIESTSYGKVIGYRAGYFSVTRESLWVLDILLEHGIRYDSSIFPVRRRLYGIADAPSLPYVAREQASQRLWEVPPSTVRLLGQNCPVAGGGYLRVLPYRFIRWSINRLNAAGRPAVMYLHPYEIDPDGIKVGHLPGGLRIRATLLSQRLKRGSFRRKLERLLGDFQFSSIKEVLGF